MCGIAGWIDWERDLSKAHATLEQMAGSLSHRGPDAQGQWTSPRAALAHRRLIVIDPETGAQPMIFKSGERQTYAITFNGEIYNFQELRRELTAKGHTFTTRSDTEVLLRAYVEWGEDCVLHLNGIFAFGVWDEWRQRLFLARDHLGVKPLFYAQRGSSVVFGSEIKALFAHPAVKPVVGAEGLAHVLGGLTLHVPGATIYQDVVEVPAGHRISFERDRTTVSHYWQLESVPHTDDLATTVQKIRELLADTVQHQLVADVPVVAMLSGGLDSSGITALAAREFRRAGQKLNSYSLDFVDHAKHFKPNIMHLDLDTPWALKVAAHAETNQRMVMLDYPDLVEHLLLPMRAHDKPSLGQMETSLYLLCKAIKRDATVALSGESADEVFGGYPWFNLPEAYNAETFPWMAILQKEHFGIESYLSADLQAKASIRSYVTRRYREALDEVPRLAGESAAAARRREVLYLNQTRLLPVLLDRKDRMSMAAGLEVRVPFCDYRLVQYVWNIPWEMKRTGDIEKGILRRALEDVLPQDVLYRRKSPYPASQNPAYVAAVRERATHILQDRNAKIRPFINPEAIAQADRDGETNPISSRYELIVQVEGWLNAYKVEIA